MHFIFFFLPIRLGASEVEAALDRLIDRCQSGAQGSVRATVEELVPLLGLKDRESAVKICSLYSKVATMRVMCKCMTWSSDPQNRKGKYIIDLLWDK